MPLEGKNICIKRIVAHRLAFLRWMPGWRAYRIVVPKVFK